MYDLRDGSYVPPHLRGPANEEPKPAVPAEPWGGVSAVPVTVTQVPCVPEWAARAGTRGPQEMYPFSTLALGCSFIIQTGDAKIESVRSMCSKKGSKLRRKFRCHKHSDGTIEVWRER